MKMKAFTLSEVLIALTVIGVIAAVTVPVIFASYTEQERVSRVKKAYSVLSQAYMRAKQDYGTADTWSDYGYGTSEGSQIGLVNLAKYIAKAKVCTSSQNCDLNREYYTLTKQKSYNWGTLRTIEALDGMQIAYYTESPDCSANWGEGQYSEICGEITVDINGAKKPNTAGYDVFKFYLTKNGVIPFGGKGASRTFENYCNKSENRNASGWACTAWIIVQGNSDYLNCNDLSWDGKHKCR